MSQEPKEINGGAETVRDRLLDAAEKLFCEKGFEGTSVRDLTSAANCNVAAVNYYFGGKDKLYLEMFRRQMQAIIDLQSQTIDKYSADPQTSLETFIRAIITPTLTSAYEKHTRGQVMHLMVREVLSKSVHSEKICDDFRTKMMDKTVNALMRLMPSLNLQQARLAFASIESLILHPFLFMEHYFRMIDGLTFEGLIEHIVQFAAAGIRNLVK